MFPINLTASEPVHNIHHQPPILINREDASKPLCRFSFALDLVVASDVDWGVSGNARRVVAVQADELLGSGDLAFIVKASLIIMRQSAVL